MNIKSLLILPAIIVSMAVLVGSADAKGPRGTGSRGSSHGVEGYVTKKGTYVAPHRATNPNRTKLDNYGTRGNVNPYTGKVGTKSPY